MQSLRVYAATGLMTALLLASSAAHAVSPPFDAAAARAAAGQPDDEKISCGKPPKPLVNLHFETMYKKGDKSFSKIDEKADAAYKKAYAPVKEFEKSITSTANRYVRAKPPRPDVAACVLDWLYAWADGNALMGEVNKNGEYIRKWLIGSAGNAYMQIRDEPSLDSGKKRAVVEWLRRAGKAAQADFTRDADMASRRNNHLYWAAWGVASAAMAVDDREMFDWAMERARFGLDEIGDDGTMPLELKRDKRAFHYHLFAALPLFLLAEAGAQNGVDLFSYNDSALKRLGALNLRNLGTGEDFEEITDKKQELKRAGTTSDLGWVEIYDKHYPGDPLAKAALGKFRPLKSSRMGGNITLLYAHISDKKK